MKYFIVVMRDNPRFTHPPVTSVPKNGTLVKISSELTSIKLSVNERHMLTLEAMFIHIFSHLKCFDNPGTNRLRVQGTCTETVTMLNNM